MFVTAYVNGRQQQKSIHITARPAGPRRCKTGDPFLDSNLFDSVSKVIWKSLKRPTRNVGNPDSREAGGYVTPTGGGYNYVPAEGPAQRCSLRFQDAPPGTTIWLHGHPVYLKETFLTACGVDARDPVTNEPATYNGGADVPDILWSRRFSITGYHIDGDGITVFDGTTTPGKWKKRYRRCGY